MKVHQYVSCTLQKNIVQRDPIPVPLRPPKQSESCHRYWLCKLSIRTEMLCYKHGIIEPEAVLLYFFSNTGSLRVLHKIPTSITSTECSCRSELVLTVLLHPFVCSIFINCLFIYHNPFKRKN